MQLPEGDGALEPALASPNAVLLLLLLLLCLAYAAFHLAPCSPKLCSCLKGMLEPPPASPSAVLPPSTVPSLHSYVR